MILIALTVSVSGYCSDVSNGSSIIISQVTGKDKKKKAAKAAKKQRNHIAKYGVRKGCKNAKRFKK